MKVVFEERRTFEGYTYGAGEHEVDEALAARLLATFPRVCKRWVKPRAKAKVEVEAKPRARARRSRAKGKGSGGGGAGEQGSNELGVA